MGIGREGIEPSRNYFPSILSAVRLPFRHRPEVIYLRHDINMLPEVRQLGK